MEDTCMTTHRSETTVVPCGGCGSLIEPTTDARRRRSWCELCAWLAADLHFIERAGRLLARHGVAHLPVDAAVSAIRDQLRSGVGPARDIATAAMRQGAERSAADARMWAVRGIEDRLHDRVRFDDPLHRWISSFGSALSPVVEEAAGWSDDELLYRLQAHVTAAIERLAATCICGHQVPHGIDGCVKRGCGCGSPARARRAEEAVKRVRALSTDDLRRMWPQQ
jgi:hypothetical protein